MSVVAVRKADGGDVGGGGNGMRIMEGKGDVNKRHACCFSTERFR